MTSAAQWRGAICAAIGAGACAGLLVLCADAPDPPPTGSVLQSEPGKPAMRAFAVSEPSPKQSLPSALRVDSDRDALAALIVALGDADANVRVDAVSDLSSLSDPQAESLLAMTAMQDPAPAVRVEALYALESLRAESQLAAFRNALADPDEDVRKAALSALEELADIRTAK
jgi:HEAT repeat protein